MRYLLEVFRLGRSARRSFGECNTAFRILWIVSCLSTGTRFGRIIERYSGLRKNWPPAALPTPSEHNNAPSMHVPLQRPRERTAEIEQQKRQRRSLRVTEHWQASDYAAVRMHASDQLRLALSFMARLSILAHIPPRNRAQNRLPNFPAACECRCFKHDP